MKKEIKKTWESPKLLNLDSSLTEVGIRPGVEGMMFSTHMVPSIPMPISEMS